MPSRYVARNRLGSVTMSPGGGHDRRRDVVEVAAAPRAERGDRDRDREHDDRREDRADHRDHHEVDDRDRRARCRTPTDIALASTASTTEIESDEHDRGRRCSDRRRVSSRRRQPERAGVDRGAEAAAERAEDVAAHADRGRARARAGREAFERAGDRAEREAGDEVAARRDQERDEARTDPGRVRAYERDRSAHRRGAGSCSIGRLGGRHSFCMTVARPEVTPGRVEDTRRHNGTIAGEFGSLAGSGDNR